MKAAIYSRKSKLTEKGGSIENQIKLCQEYALRHFGIGDDEIIVYEDEGFSGGNTARPKFQQMMRDAQGKKFQTVICYRLDRVSRNIGDFSIFADGLQKLGIAFVSIREQFDTTTPMGRAMMYIASVFAQLERETIAERIRDNMLELAKIGRWLGGNTPTGYISQPIEIPDCTGVRKKAFKLAVSEKEAALVRLLYNKYLQLNSLRKLETYCVQNDIKSKNNKKLSRFSLTGILRNPVYVRADERVYDYFINNGYEIYSAASDFNGINGVLTYNKTDIQGTRNISEWVIAIGAHEGIISATDWLAVQLLLDQNKGKGFRNVRSPNSLLSGLLRCGNCGSIMRPKADKKSGFTYMCELKEISKKSKCSMKNLNGSALDEIIVSCICSTASNPIDIDAALVLEEAKLHNAEYNLGASAIEEKIKLNIQAIESLITSLENRGTSPGAAYVMDRIDAIAKKNAALEQTLAETEKNAKAECNAALFKNLSDTMAEATTEEKRRFIRSIVRKVSWDGECVTVELE